MDANTKLINEFKAENTNRLDNIDKSRKPNIIMALEDYADDLNVVDFLILVAANESEYDIARIEAFKVFERKDYTNLDMRTKIANVIQEVLIRSCDDNVRNYAAMAAAYYLDNENVYKALAQILLDRQENSNLRWNAFAAMKTNGISNNTIDLLRKMISDDEFKSSASRVLSEWRAWQ